MFPPLYNNGFTITTVFASQKLLVFSIRLNRRLEVQHRARDGRDTARAFAGAERERRGARARVRAARLREGVVRPNAQRDRLLQGHLCLLTPNNSSKVYV